MNREIKFRAWIKEEKIMTDVKNLYYDNNGLNKVTGRQKLLMITRRPFEDSLIGDFELMQYTGLKDKNGVEIYEGDILSTDLSRPYLVVEFRNGAFMFQCHDNGKDYYDFMTTADDNSNFTKCHEVIGNIYENKELLKGTNK